MPPGVELQPLDERQVRPFAAHLVVEREVTNLGVGHADSLAAAAQPALPYCAVMLRYNSGNKYTPRPPVRVSSAALKEKVRPQAESRHRSSLLKVDRIGCRRTSQARRVDRHGRARYSETVTDG